MACMQHIASLRPRGWGLKWQCLNFASLAPLFVCRIFSESSSGSGDLLDILPRVGCEVKTSWVELGMAHCRFTFYSTQCYLVLASCPEITWWVPFPNSKQSNKCKILSVERLKSLAIWHGIQEWIQQYLSNVMTAVQIYKFEVYVMLSHTFSIPLSNTWLICESKYVCHFTDSCFWRYWGDFWGTNKIPSWLTGETKVSNLSPGNLSRKSDFVFTSECRNRP